MSTINSLHTGASAMMAHSWGMAVTAHNVANVSTAGFHPQHAVFATGPQGQGVRLDAVLQDRGVFDDPSKPQSARPVDPQSPPAFTGDVLPQGLQPSRTELAREIPQMMRTERTYEANAQVVRTADDMMGTLLDLKA